MLFKQKYINFNNKKANKQVPVQYSTHKYLFYTKYTTISLCTSEAVSSELPSELTSPVSSVLLPPPNRLLIVLPISDNEHTQILLFHVFQSKQRYNATNITKN